MALVDQDLASLLVRIDDWFTDITLDEPIEQFILDEDRARLALKSRTTGNWFRSLSNPLTNDGLEDVNKCSSDSTHVTESDEEFDSLVRDLEDLIENEEEEDDICSSHLVFHELADDDEKSLLDVTIGSCCTLDLDSCTVQNLSNSKTKHEFEPMKKFSVILGIGTVEEPLRVTKTPSQAGDGESDLMKHKHATPFDHDYLARPRSKPLVSNNRQFQNLVPEAKSGQVLNTEALKRFAPFSNKIRDLIDKHDKLLAVSMSD